MAKKIRVLVLYGGRSGEHEVSLRSASSVIQNLDASRFDIIPVGITKKGTWHLGDYKKIITEKPEILSIDESLIPMTLVGSRGDEPATLLPVSGEGPQSQIDVVFPVMHGPECEDGVIQGFCQQVGVPYVGAGVLASAIGMDKDITKKLLMLEKIPVVPYVTFRKDEWMRAKDKKQILAKIKKLKLPLFVKPANLGSSVGIHKVNKISELDGALMDAFKYDSKVLVEKGLSVREIELSVLENPENSQDPRVSVAGEIVPSHEFYSYDAKYIDEGGASLLIPAKLTKSQMNFVQAFAKKVFVTLQGQSMARVDLFLDKKRGKFYLNEVNTIPGFTKISMYPKMWEASGLSYDKLLSTLIDLAFRRRS